MCHTRERVMSTGWRVESRTWPTHAARHLRRKPPVPYQPCVRPVRTVEILPHMHLCLKTLLRILRLHVQSLMILPHSVCGRQFCWKGTSGLKKAGQKSVSAGRLGVGLNAVTHTRTHKHMHLDTHLRKRPQAHTRIDTHAHKRYVFKHILTYYTLHTYIHTYVHTYIHTMIRT